MSDESPFGNDQGAAQGAGAQPAQQAQAQSAQPTQPYVPQPVQPAQQVIYQKDPNEPSLGDWVLTIFLTFIPLVNIIMLLVWAFSDSTPSSKKLWARANLIWVLIAIAVSIIILIFFGAAVYSFVDYANKQVTQTGAMTTISGILAGIL